MRGIDVVKQGQPGLLASDAQSQEAALQDGQRALEQELAALLGAGRKDFLVAVWRLIDHSSYDFASVSDALAIVANPPGEGETGTLTLPILERVRSKCALFVCP